jgi:hypothetical protein
MTNRQIVLPTMSLSSYTLLSRLGNGGVCRRESRYYISLKENTDYTNSTLRMGVNSPAHFLYDLVYPVRC